MSDELDDAITEAASGPREMTVDGITTKEHSLPDLIAYDRHQASKTAAKKGGGFSVRKIRPGGSI
ncbi:MAG: hypothetical protein COA78_24790 [Blastopirellula sp.]|nr:MAG: hypothetical protein COA78_24790 [Blastopirellula sp.]